MKRTDLHVGICAGYNWDEATYLAGELWDFLTKVLRVPADFYSATLPVDGLHFRWDRELTHKKRTPWTTWLFDKDLVIWFGIFPDLLRETPHSKTKHYLVCLPRTFPPDFQAEHLALFDRVFCPTQEICRRMSRYLPESQLTYVPWDVSPPIAECEKDQKTPNRLLVALETVAAKDVDPTIFSMLHMLLDVIPSLEIDILRGRRWPSTVVAALEHLLTSHPKNVHLHARPTYQKLTSLYRKASWVLCADVAADVGEPALRAVCLGRPVIAYQAPPYTEILTDQYNAKLTCCEKPSTDTHTARITPNSHHLYVGLLEACAKPKLWYHVMGQPWTSVEQRRRQFTEFWKHTIETRAQNCGTMIT